MGKILGSWSGMRKYLEQEMLAESLKGRVRYGCTTYPGMDGSHVFELCIDGQQVKRFSWETVNSYFIDTGLSSQPKNYYWENFLPLLEGISVSERDAHTDDEFCEALTVYRAQEIQKSLSSENPLVRMFAVLDRRVGKRSLEKLKETLPNQPAWLRDIYGLRLCAEGIPSKGVDA